MTHDFLNYGDQSVNLASVSSVTFDKAGGLTLHMTSGGAISVPAGDDADAIAKKLGRHDARHLTAKEAHAAAKAAEPEPAKEAPKAHGHK